IVLGTLWRFRTRRRDTRCGRANGSCHSSERRSESRPAAGHRRARSELAEVDRGALEGFEMRASVEASALARVRAELAAWEPVTVGAAVTVRLSSLDVG